MLSIQEHDWRAFLIPKLKHVISATSNRLQLLTITVLIFTVTQGTARPKLLNIRDFDKGAGLWTGRRVY